MDTKIKEEWLKDLETAKKGQCALLTVSDGSMCCLGVLAETVKRLFPEKDIKWYTISNPNVKMVSYNGDKTLSSYLPESLARELGIEEHQPNLARLNDNSATFEEEVIPYIKENL